MPLGLPMREFPGRLKRGGKIYSESGENERPGALSAVVVVVVWKWNEGALGAGERSPLVFWAQQGAVQCHTNGIWHCHRPSWFTTPLVDTQERKCLVA